MPKFPSRMQKKPAVIGKHNALHKAEKALNRAHSLRKAGHKAIGVGAGVGLIADWSTSTPRYFFAGAAAGALAGVPLLAISKRINFTLLAKCVGNQRFAARLSTQAKDPQIKRFLKALARMPKLNMTERESLKALFKGNATTLERNIAERLLEKHLKDL